MFIDGERKSVSLPDDNFGFIVGSKQTHGIEMLADKSGTITMLNSLAGRGNLSAETKELLIDQAKLLEALAMSYRLIAYDPYNEPKSD